jgi:hypothetical protein
MGRVCDAGVAGGGGPLMGGAVRDTSVAVGAGPLIGADWDSGVAVDKTGVVVGVLTDCGGTGVLVAWRVVRRAEVLVGVVGDCAIVVVDVAVTWGSDPPVGVGVRVAVDKTDVLLGVAVSVAVAVAVGVLDAATGAVGVGMTVAAGVFVAVAVGVLVAVAVGVAVAGSRS